jgi:hypothetical protein
VVFSVIFLSHSADLTVAASPSADAGLNTLPNAGRIARLRRPSPAGATGSRTPSDPAGGSASSPPPGSIRGVTQPAIVGKGDEPRAETDAHRRHPTITRALLRAAAQLRTISRTDTFMACIG